MNVRSLVEVFDARDKERTNGRVVMFADGVRTADFYGLLEAVRTALRPLPDVNDVSPSFEWGYFYPQNRQSVDFAVHPDGITATQPVSMLLAMPVGWTGANHYNRGGEELELWHEVTRISPRFYVAPRLEHDRFPFVSSRLPATESYANDARLIQGASRNVELHDGAYLAGVMGPKSAARLTERLKLPGWELHMSIPSMR